MRSLFSKVQVSTLALGLAVGGIIACGEDDPEPKGQDYNPGTGDGDGSWNPPGDGDGNTGGDGDGSWNGGDGDNTGGDGGLPGTCITVQGISAAPCAGNQTFQKCENNVPVGECGPITDLIGDLFGDGGVKLPDLGNLGPCPAPTTCGGLGGPFSAIVQAVIDGSGLVPPGSSLCGTDGSLLNCETKTCAEQGLPNATCAELPVFGTTCVQPCKVSSTSP